tara:strand:- start:731 stop:907 length:177 start_codon:yes stop_codon:yes gene_type:complete
MKKVIRKWLSIVVFVFCVPALTYGIVNVYNETGGWELIFWPILTFFLWLPIYLNKEKN